MLKRSCRSLKNKETPKKVTENRKVGSIQNGTIFPYRNLWVGTQSHDVPVTTLWWEVNIITRGSVDRSLFRLTTDFHTWFRQCLGNANYWSQYMVQHRGGHSHFSLDLTTTAIPTVDQSYSLDMRKKTDLGGASSLQGYGSYMSVTCAWVGRVQRHTSPSSSGLYSDPWALRTRTFHRHTHTHTFPV